MAERFGDVFGHRLGQARLPLGRRARPGPPAGIAWEGGAAREGEDCVAGTFASTFRAASGLLFGIDVAAGFSAVTLEPDAPVSGRAITGGFSAEVPASGPSKPATATIPGHDNAAAKNNDAGRTNRPKPRTYAVADLRGLRGS